eukprot:13257061-Ditylum_brightwellii.AAC.1
MKTSKRRKTKQFKWSDKFNSTTKVLIMGRLRLMTVKLIHLSTQISVGQRRESTTYAAKTKTKQIVMENMRWIGMT